MVSSRSGWAVLRTVRQVLAGSAVPVATGRPTLVEERGIAAVSQDLLPRRLKSRPGVAVTPLASMTYNRPVTYEGEQSRRRWHCLGLTVWSNGRLCYLETRGDRLMQLAICGLSQVYLQQLFEMDTA